MPGNDLPAWVKPSAVFAVDGSTEKILSVTPAGIEVVTFDSFGSWPVSSFLAAIASGRIIRPGTSDRVKRRPARRLPASARHAKLPQLAEQLGGLAITDPTPAAVIRTVLHTLRALRSGQGVQPPAAVLVEQLARAGAYAEGLGPTIALRPRRGGRPPYFQAEAQEAQALLARFTRWLLGDDDFNRGEFRTIEHFVERGLEAFGLTAPPPGRPRGRPEGHSSDAVRDAVSRHWHAYQRGKYSVRRAVLEVAEEAVLHDKRVAAAWAGQDHQAVQLGPDDEEALGRAFSRIERAYYDRPPLTKEEVVRRRAELAAMLRLTRRIALGKNHFPQ